MTRSKREARDRCLEQGLPLFGVRYYEIFKATCLRINPTLDARSIQNLDALIRWAGEREA